MNRVLGIGLLAICGAVLPAAAAGAVPPLTIAVITRGSADPLWQDILRGAQQAARDLHAAVTVEGPSDEPAAAAGAAAAGTPGSADQQAALVESALSRKPSALCIDALDSRAIAPLLEKAREANIRVLGFGAGVDSALVSATAAVDEASAAALAANKLAAYVGGEGRVGVIAADPGGARSERVDGFKAELARRYPDIEIEGPYDSAGDAQRSVEQAKLLIQSIPALKGIFAADEVSAAGALKTVQELDLAGRVVVVGFDSGQAQVDAVRSGLEAGAVTPDPIRMGYKVVEAAVDLLQGRRVPRRIDTGFHWYDRANVDDPSIAILLHP